MKIKLADIYGFLSTEEMQEVTRENLVREELVHHILLDTSSSIEIRAYLKGKDIRWTIIKDFGVNIDNVAIEDLFRTIKGLDG